VSTHRRQALQELDGLLSRPTLRPAHCRTLVTLVELVPGRRADVARCLAQEMTRKQGPEVSAILACILELPSELPGVSESVTHAVRRGISRLRPDGTPCPAMLAIDFPASRTRDLPELVDRARRFAAHTETRFDSLRLRSTKRSRVGRSCFRLWLSESEALGRSLRTAAGHLTYLHRRLVRLKGTRLWIDGWCFQQDDPLRPAVQAYLVQAWIDRVIATGC
jgi:hypothetical protein